jgi:predicted RNA-binding protein with RPS1 domain
MIRQITEECQVSIDVEDDGTIAIASTEAASTEKAIAWIKSLTDDVEVGRVYKGKVVRLMPFGAFVEVLPKKDGLVHVSKLADWRVNNVEDFVQVGDEILVKVDEIDRQGRVNLSRREALKEAEKWGLSEADEKFANPPVRPEPGDEPALVGDGGGYRDREPRGGGYGGGSDREGGQRSDRPSGPRFRGNRPPRG